MIANRVFLFGWLAILARTAGAVNCSSCGTRLRCCGGGWPTVAGRAVLSALAGQATFDRARRQPCLLIFQLHRPRPMPWCALRGDERIHIRRGDLHRSLTIAVKNTSSDDTLGYADGVVADRVTIEGGALQTLLLIRTPVHLALGENLIRAGHAAC